MGTKYRGVIARGNTSIQIAFALNGQRCRETLAIPPTPANLKYAAQKRAAILFEIEKGSFDYRAHFPNSRSTVANSVRSGSHTTIEHALKEWLRSSEKRHAYSTVRGYGSAVHFYLIPNFGHFRLNELERSHIEQWINSAAISPKRINNTLIPLRQIYENAFVDGVIVSNPLTRIKNLKVQSREPQPFTPNEIEKILTALEGPEKNLIQFAFWSGLRTSELIGLAWANVDLENNRIYVRQSIVHGRLKDTKTSAGDRIVELQPLARVALISQKAISCNPYFVFFDPKTKQHWKDDQVIRKRIWIPALRKAGVNYREPYQTRHTFASRMLTDGRNPMWVAAQMGHRDWGMIRKVYGRYIPSPETSLLVNHAQC
jgi:integrase